MLSKASIFKMKDALVYVQRLFQSRKVSRSDRAHLHELCRQFSLAEIKAATDNFHQDLKIGGGMSTDVYKGFVDNGTLTVAVKRFKKSSCWGIYELYKFKNEVRFLCQLHHPNLISLIGFCHEKDEMIIVYEYMKNLSLDRYVNEPLEADRDPLSWEQRLNICIAVARALHYLHAGVRYGVLHSNLKSCKILLDENWTAKISDFGSSKMGQLSMSKTALIKTDYNIVVGTFGYLDPEYVTTGKLTKKSDVFSFGALMLEVLSSRKEDQMLLVEYARNCIENSSINAIVDTYLEGKIAPECLQKFLEIAFDCLHEKGRDRPSMGEVEVTLELALELQERAQLQSQSN